MNFISGSKATFSTITLSTFAMADLFNYTLLKTNNQFLTLTSRIINKEIIHDLLTIDEMML